MAGVKQQAKAAMGVAMGADLSGTNADTRAGALLTAAAGTCCAVLQIAEHVRVKQEVIAAEAADLAAAVADVEAHEQEQAAKAEAARRAADKVKVERHQQVRGHCKRGCASGEGPGNIIPRHTDCCMGVWVDRKSLI